MDLSSMSPTRLPGTPRINLLRRSVSPAAEVPGPGNTLDRTVHSGPPAASRPVARLVNGAVGVRQATGGFHVSVHRAGIQMRGSPRPNWDERSVLLQRRPQRSFDIERLCIMQSLYAA